MPSLTAGLAARGWVIADIAEPPALQFLLSPAFDTDAFLAVFADVLAEARSGEAVAAGAGHVYGGGEGADGEGGKGGMTVSLSPLSEAAPPFPPSPLVHHPKCGATSSIRRSIWSRWSQLVMRSVTSSKPSCSIDLQVLHDLLRRAERHQLSSASRV